MYLHRGALASIILFLLSLPTTSATAESKEEATAREQMEAAIEETRKKYELTKEYVNEWIPFSPVKGKLVDSGEPVTIKPPKGKAFVVVFIASWCLPCQKIVANFLEIEKKHQGPLVDFLYVFVNDTRKDIVGFKNSYKMNDNILAGNMTTLNDFKQPKLPSIFASDRHSWLSYRSIKSSREDLQKLDNFLELIASY